MLLEPYCVPDGTEITEERGVTVCSKGIAGARMRTLPAWRRRLPFLKNWENHMPAERIRTYIGKEKWDASLKIATVRDPYARMVSMFHWRARNEDTNAWSDDEAKERFLTFLNGSWPDDSRIVMIDGECVVDHFIRFENRDADIAELGRKLGITLDPSSLQHTKNTTSARRSRSTDDYYTPEAREVVERRLHWLFDKAGYTRKSA
ncbi:hypothetical protein [Primorskyibacter flagellatus]|nr:hypothetical protein [Primorskyibacter flagellatus]